MHRLYVCVYSEEKSSNRAQGLYWGILARGRGRTDRGSIFPSTDRARSVSKKLILWDFNFLVVCFCKPVSCPWELRENNAVEFSHGYKHKPYNNIVYWSIIIQNFGVYFALILPVGVLCYI